MKKIIVVKGSPRANGNSDTMADAAIAAMGKDVEVIEFALRDKTVNGCKGCGGCKGEKIGCVQKDDMAALIDELRSCDGLILASPVYFGYITGPCKTFIDRLYALFNPAKGPLVEAKPRKLGVILTFGGSPVEAMDAMSKSVAGCFGVLGISEMKNALAGGCQEKSACKDKPEYLAKAAELGKWLAE